MAPKPYERAAMGGPPETTPNAHDPAADVRFIIAELKEHFDNAGEGAAVSLTSMVNSRFHARVKNAAAFLGLE